MMRTKIKELLEEKKSLEAKLIGEAAVQEKEYKEMLEATQKRLAHREEEFATNYELLARKFKAQLEEADQENTQLNLQIRAHTEKKGMRDKLKNLFWGGENKEPESGAPP